MLATTLRSARLAGHVAVGVGASLALKLDRQQRIAREPLTSWWNAKLLNQLALRCSSQGQAPSGGCLIVANHVSWLDIPLIVAHARTRFVSKSEVQAWPVAGWLADAAGSFYIQRGRHAVRPLLDQLVPFLAGGGTVTVFPEGTTTDGSEVRPFHARLFAAAIEAGVPVQPLALSYGLSPDGQALAPFIGEDELLAHLLRLVGNAGGLDASLHWLPPITAAGMERSALADAACSAVREALAPPARLDRAA